MSDYLHSNSPPEGRQVTVAAVAVVLSVVLHLILYHAVGSRSLALLDLLAPARREAASKKASSMRAELIPPAPPAQPSKDPLQSGTGAGQGGSEDDGKVIDRLSGPTPASIFEPPAGTSDPLPPTSLDRLAPPPDPGLPVWTPRQEILSILDAADRDARAPIPRREIPLIERQLLAPDITASYDLLAGLARSSVSGTGTPAITSPLSVSFSPASLPSGGDDEWPQPQMGPEAEGDTATSLIAEIPAAVAPAHPLDDRLRIAVETYAPSRGSDGYLYFRIDVHRKDDEALPGLPRDIVFVQDTSGSLGERYLHPCRLAIREVVATLRPEDRFNIIQFSHTTSRCFVDWALPSPESIAQSEAFLGAMVSEGKTDLFSSMAEVLSLSRTKGRPMIAVIITDGNVTAGQLERDSQIIGTFTRLNAGEVSVFTVGALPRANRFLLDMLSYCNRGGNTEIAPDRFNVAQTILRLNQSILRPLLGDVRFNFDVVSGAEVYPQLTTNLYEDRPLQLFGRVRVDHPVVAFQARGSAGDERYDMLFEVDLLGRDAASGGRGLATQWATQRMYDLVARYARSDDAGLLAEMQRLGSDFGIPVPYRSRLPGASADGRQ